MNFGNDCNFGLKLLREIELFYIGKLRILGEEDRIKIKPNQNFNFQPQTVVTKLRWVPS